MKDLVTLPLLNWRNSFKSFGCEVNRKKVTGCKAVKRGNQRTIFSRKAFR